MTLFPFENHLFKTEKPFVEYNFEIEKAGEYQVEIRFLPTHSNNFDHQVFVSVNDRKPTEYSLNTRGRSEAWKENTLRNFVSITLPISIENTGTQNLKIAVNQPGIVIDQIALTPKNYQKFYEIIH